MTEYIRRIEWFERTEQDGTIQTPQKAAVIIDHKLRKTFKNIWKKENEAPYAAQRSQS